MNLKFSSVVAVMLLVATPFASGVENQGWKRGPDKAPARTPTLAIVATAEAAQDAALHDTEGTPPSTDTPAAATPNEIIPPGPATGAPGDVLPDGAYIESIDGEYFDPKPVPRADGAPDCGPLCRLQCAPFVLPAPSGLNAGFEAVIAKPYFATSSAPRFGGGQATVPEKWEFDMAPRAWLGYTLPGGMGGRFRYWQFDHHSLQQ
ncbi:MAG: hypothetical protein AB7U73_23180, partial [Pirellulales bacterium]